MKRIFQQMGTKEIFQWFFGKVVDSVHHTIASIHPVDGVGQPIDVSGCQLTFGDGAIDVFNPFKVQTPDGEASAEILKGMTVMDMENKGATFLIFFKGGALLEIDLHDDSYVGPEAVCFTAPDIGIAAW